jgi:Asp-tRNA(Asn)/Glu-tRNA(Gln) amidotransferase A subunit family amidase
MLNQEHIVPVVGPLSTSLEGVKIFTKTLIDAQPWLYQPALLPIPWRINQDWLPKSKDGTTKLKIAVLWDDGVVKPHPPVTRALTEMCEKLKSVPGVELIDWKPFKHDLAWEIIVSCLR